MRESGGWLHRFHIAERSVPKRYKTCDPPYSKEWSDMWHPTGVMGIDSPKWGLLVLPQLLDICSSCSHEFTSDSQRACGRIAIGVYMRGNGNMHGTLRLPHGPSNATVATGSGRCTVWGKVTRSAVQSFRLERRTLRERTVKLGYSWRYWDIAEGRTQSFTETGPASRVHVVFAGLTCAPTCGSQTHQSTLGKRQTLRFAMQGFGEANSSCLVFRF